MWNLDISAYVLYMFHVKHCGAGGPVAVPKSLSSFLVFFVFPFGHGPVGPGFEGASTGRERRARALFLMSDQ